jgi:ADP-heptose:LPS heptosyltransferase
MNVLIIKLGATGDVVRTTPLLNQLSGEITWVTAIKNIPIVEGVRGNVRALPWEDRHQALDRPYELAINLEDAAETGGFLKEVQHDELFGAYIGSDNLLKYTESSKRWFDLSIVSVYGKEKADQLKFENRLSYQELIFNGLGLQFAGEKYVLPRPIQTELLGNVAIAAEAGLVWPMKKWAYYEQLKDRLEDQGLVVNVLPKRSSLLEHLSDVVNHRCLVGGDSLPMHFALGAGIPCVTLFTCTSPWEIHDYGIQKKIVSPLLKEFFYKRGYDKRATTAISVDEVFDAVLTQLEKAEPVRAVSQRLARNF